MFIIVEVNTITQAPTTSYGPYHTREEAVQDYNTLIVDYQDDPVDFYILNLDMY